MSGGILNLWSGFIYSSACHNYTASVCRVKESIFVFLFFFFFNKLFFFFSMNFFSSFLNIFSFGFFFFYVFNGYLIALKDVFFRGKKKIRGGEARSWVCVTSFRVYDLNFYSPYYVKLNKVRFFLRVFRCSV